jgi:hypothetical protein
MTLAKVFPKVLFNNLWSTAWIQALLHNKLPVPNLPDPRKPIFSLGDIHIATWLCCYRVVGRSAVLHNPLDMESSVRTSKDSDSLVNPHEELYGLPLIYLEYVLT